MASVGMAGCGLQHKPRHHRFLPAWSCFPSKATVLTAHTMHCATDQARSAGHGSGLCCWDVARAERRERGTELTCHPWTDIAASPLDLFCCTSPCLSLVPGSRQNYLWEDAPALRWLIGLDLTCCTCGTVGELSFPLASSIPPRTEALCPHRDSICTLWGKERNNPHGFWG